MTNRHWVQAGHPCRVRFWWASQRFLLPLGSLCPSPFPFFPSLSFFYPSVLPQDPTPPGGEVSDPQVLWFGGMPQVVDILQPSPSKTILFPIVSLWYILRLRTFIQHYMIFTPVLFPFTTCPNIPSGSGWCIRAVGLVRTFLKAVTNVGRSVLLHLLIL